MARRFREGEVAYTVEFGEGVDADVDPLLVDARRGLGGWHGGVLHRRRRRDSHGADGAACKHEQRVIVFVRFASLLILQARASATTFIGSRLVFSTFSELRATLCAIGKKSNFFAKHDADECPQ